MIRYLDIVSVPLLLGGAAALLRGWLLLTWRSPSMKDWLTSHISLLISMATTRLHRFTHCAGCCKQPTACSSLLKSIHRSRFVEVECRACEPVYQRRHFLQAARRPGQGIKGFKAEQRKECVNSLIERLSRRKHVLLDEPLHDHAYPPPSPFVSC